MSIQQTLALGQLHCSSTHPLVTVFLQLIHPVQLSLAIPACGDINGWLTAWSPFPQPSARHWLTLPDHGYGVSTFCGVPVFQ